MSTTIKPTLKLDVDLLRKQRDNLLDVQEYGGTVDSDTAAGLVNLLDHLLDVAEGHA